MTTDLHADRLALYGRPHVLVAHEEEAMRKGLMGILSRAGYDVDGAGDVDEGLVMLDKVDVGALVVSFGLPADGCRSLLDAAGRLPPTVVLSAPTDDVTALSDDSHVQSVLTRPFRLQALYDAVALATGQGRPRNGH